MVNEALLGSLTDLIGTLAQMLFAVVNFYGLVIIAVVGWIVNTAKDAPGISWFRIVMFNLGLAFFFAATFAGFWYIYDRLASALELWAGIAGPQAGTLVWLPPQEWLFGVWGLNAVIMVLATVLLRKGGYGRRATPLVQ